MNLDPCPVPSAQDYALVIPAHNEADTIRPVVTGALAYLARVIVVDDGSTDGTAEALAGLPVTLLRNAENLGKAGALWRGLTHALQEPLRGVLTMDGDGQHDPGEIPKLLSAAQRFSDHLVVGSRLWNRSVIPTARYRANRFANFWIGWASGQPVEDSQCGFRCYPVELIRRVRLGVGRERSFVFESEILIEASRLAFPYLPVPIRALYPEEARPSHFRPVTDIALITKMVAWKLLSRGLYLNGLWRSLQGNRTARGASSPAGAAGHES